MAEFRIRIAGYTAGVSSLFASTRDYCGRYLTEEVPQCHITVTREDLDFEQEFLRQEALEEGIKVRKFTDPFLERTSIQRRVADALLERDTLMLHGSTVAVDGKAYLFTAPCGTGKSTHTRLWRELFGDRAVMVNDDKPFLQITPNGVLAYGSPWSGKHGLATNICVPLHGICSLRRGENNQIRPATPQMLLPLLRHQAHMPEDASLHEKVYVLMDRLTELVPLWEMDCNNRKPDAAQVSACAMYYG
jgi:hypothetical protein